MRVSYATALQMHLQRIDLHVMLYTEPQLDDDSEVEGHFTLCPRQGSVTSVEPARAGVEKGSAGVKHRLASSAANQNASVPPRVSDFGTRRAAPLPGTRGGMYASPEMSRLRTLCDLRLTPQSATAALAAHNGDVDRAACHSFERPTVPPPANRSLSAPPSPCVTQEPERPSQGIMVTALLAIGIPRRLACMACREHPEDTDAAAAWAWDQLPSTISPMRRRPRVCCQGPAMRIDWRAVGPPDGALGRTDSWILVPLLWDAVGELRAEACGAWRKHALTSAWWERTRNELAAAGPRAIDEIVEHYIDMWDGAEDAALKQNDGDLADVRRAAEDCYTRMTSGRHVSPHFDHMTLEEAASVMKENNYYIPSPGQETLFAAFGGDMFNERLVMHVGAFRTSYLGRGHDASNVLGSVAPQTDIRCSSGVSTGAVPQRLFTTMESQCIDLDTEPLAATSACRAPPSLAPAPTTHAPGSDPTLPQLGLPTGQVSAASNSNASRAAPRGPSSVGDQAASSTDNRLESAATSACHTPPSWAPAPSTHAPGSDPAHPPLSSPTGQRIAESNSNEPRPALRDPPHTSMQAASPPPRPSVAEFWKARKASMDAAVDRLYCLHRQHPNEHMFVVESFLELPDEWPVLPEHFGLSYEDVFAHEIATYEQFIFQTRHRQQTICHAYDEQLDYVKLGPFFLAVLCSFIPLTGTPPAMLFGLLHSVGGWVQHKECHAVFSTELNRKTRARAYIQVVADSNVGKSKLFDVFLKPWLDIVSASSFSHLFVDGGTKGVHIATATAAEFGQRVKEADGYPFWATPENLLCLDLAWAMGRVPEKSERKTDMHELLETQNGLNFGLTSVKSAKEQVHVPRTNMGWYHMGQPRVVHDYWGQAF